MADIVISGNTSGSVTLRAPDVSGTTLLTLPTTSGTIVTTAGATSLTTSGNLTFTGTSNRITGLFDGATLSNRVLFQTSTTNANTSVGVMPNGTGVYSDIALYSSSDPANASRVLVNISSAGGVASIATNATGSGTNLPLTFQTGGSERLRIDTSGNVGIGVVPNTGTVSKLFSGGDFTRVGGSGGFLFNLQYSSTNARWEYAGTGTGAGWIDSGSGNYTFQSTGSTSGSANGAASALAERMRITSGGYLLVNTTSDALNSATAQFKVTGNTGSIAVDTTGTNILFSRNGTNYIVANGGASATIQVISNTGGVQLSNGATSWTAVSDETKKDIIEPISNAVEKVSTLRAVIGKYKTDEEGTRRSFLIAQDVQKVLPEAISTVSNEDGDALGLSYTDTIPLLVAAIKEQQAMIHELKARIDVLEGAK